MVRPKASEANLQAAVSFVDLLIVRELSDGSSLGMARVHRKGSHSLFAAFRAFVPELVRRSRDKNPENRQGVSIIELNKALKSSGLKCNRKRDRTEDGVKWLYKVRTQLFQIHH